MIDFNAWEIALIVVVAIIIFGPDKLPEFARKAARVLAHLRRIGNDARSQLRAELGPEFDDLHLSDLNPRGLVQRHLLSADEISDIRSVRDEVRTTGDLLKESVDAGRTPGSGATAATAVSHRDPPPSAAAPIAVRDSSVHAGPGDSVRATPFDPEST